jgi:hypothetical protein
MRTATGAVSPRPAYHRVPRHGFLASPGIDNLPAFIVNFCLKTGPMPARVSPSFAALQDRCAALMKPMRAGDPSPCDGRSGFVRADRNHKAGNGAGLTEKETKMSNTKKNEEAETKNPPVAKIRVDLINASIWRNKTEKGIFYNVTFESRYRDGEGNWKSSHNYTSNDLLALAKAADLAHTKIVELRNSSEE